jgi:hypothetical protein
MSCFESRWCTGVAVSVWGLCARVLGVSDEDLERVPCVEKIDVKWFVQLLGAYERAISV